MIIHVTFFYPYLDSVELPTVRGQYSRSTPPAWTPRRGHRDWGFTLYAIRWASGEGDPHSSPSRDETVKTILRSRSSQSCPLVLMNNAISYLVVFGAKASASGTIRHRKRYAVLISMHGCPQWILIVRVRDSKRPQIRVLHDRGWG